MNTIKRNTVLLNPNQINFHKEKLFDVKHIGVYSDSSDRVILEIDNFELILFDSKLNYNTITIGDNVYEIKFNNDFSVLKNNRRTRLFLTEGELAIYLHKEFMNLEL